MKHGEENLWSESFEEFWESQQNNPNAYLSFWPGEGHYQLVRRGHAFYLEGYSGDEGFGAFPLLESREANPGYKDYAENDQSWSEMLDAYYRLLTTPCQDENFRGRSMRQVFSQLKFED